MCKFAAKPRPEPSSAALTAESGAGHPQHEEAAKDGDEGRPNQPTRLAAQSAIVGRYKNGRDSIGCIRARLGEPRNPKVKGPGMSDTGAFLPRGKFLAGFASCAPFAKLPGSCSAPDLDRI